MLDELISSVVGVEEAESKSELVFVDGKKKFLYKGEIGRLFTARGMHHFTEEYQVAKAGYEAQKRNWDITHEDGIFKLVDSKEQVTETYFDGKFVCCGCEEFHSNQTATCMHGEILRLEEVRIQFSDEIRASKKTNMVCGTYIVDGKWALWKRKDDRGKVTCKENEVSDYRKLPGVDRFLRKDADLPFDETDYGDVNVFKQITMRDYQVESIKKMLRSKRTVTTLKMGLGKTVCAMAAMALLNKDKNLIVCPASLKYQWQKEIKKFLGCDAKLIMSSKNLAKYDLSNKPKYTIINYELVGKLEFFLDDWDVTVLDEIQKVRNKETIAWKCLSALKSDYIMALSGTVIENRVEDLISVIEILNPNELNPHWKFYSDYCQCSKIKVLGFKREMMSKLKERFDRYIVNPTIDYTQFVVPTAEKWNEEVKWINDDQRKNHDGPFEAAKNLLSIGNNRPLTFSEQIALNGLLVKARLASSDMRLSDPKVEIKGNKMIRFGELIEDLVINQGRKIVVYSDWIKMLKLAELELLSKGVRYIMYNGEMTLKKRNQCLDEFIGEPNCKVMLSTDTGGLGVDGLQMVSDAVVHLEMVWNPAKFDQRNGRVVRALNPNKKVDVYYVYTNEGVEMMMQTATIRKSGLRDEFFS